MRYFVSYAYGGIKHAHDQDMFSIAKITDDNFDESMEHLKLLIEKKHRNLCFDAMSDLPCSEDLPEMISILFYKEI